MKDPYVRQETHKFPVGRGVLAMVVPAVLTPLIMFVLGIVPARPSVREIALLPVMALIFAWPGALVGLLLGLPTAYWLFRRRQTGFIAYVLVGAFYTVAPLIVGQALTTSARYLPWIPVFALIGLLNGALARIILFGWG
jgi:hypothetical protein